MADRAFERIFAEASAAVESQQERLDPEKQKQKQKKNEESQIRSLMSSMTADDAIERILLAEKERDYFRCATGFPFLRWWFYDSCTLREDVKLSSHLPAEFSNFLPLT